jgi:hypothetical protein
MVRSREATAIAPDVGEDPVAAFVLQGLQGPRENLGIVH